MLKSFFTRRNMFLVFGALVLLSLIGFVEKKAMDKKVSNVIINIEDEYGSHFVDEEDVLRIIAGNNADSLRGKNLEEINLKSMEKKIKTNKFIDKAEVYKDHKGNLLVDIKQCKPIARVVQEYGPHAYIGDNGNILPVSEKFTARVVIIDGENATRFMDSTFVNSTEAKIFVSMIHLIDKDPFLKAQVSQITYRKNGEVELRPQVGSEVIYLGKLNDLEIKLNKVKVYYKQIVQLKGFNKYRIVNLKYKDQIICE
jgi:cell division protein FtsQ